MISERTKAALAAAKARGKRLGNPRLPDATATGWANQRAAAEQRAANVLPMTRELQASGIVSHNAIAAALNARGVPTARGREWTHVQVGTALARAGA
jgi:DNA invertase Pin-like site-specific DNA recombinase